MTVITRDNPLPIVPLSFTALFRDSFDTYTPNTNWTQTLASGDILRLDGNAIGSSYLVLSKDPLSQGTTSSLTSVMSMTMPVELGVSVHMSQRTLGQEFALELVSTDTPLTSYTPVAISTISQATTTLTVNTATPHNLAIGNAVTIYGVSDSRMNYPSLVVAGVPSPTQFVATAGPGGTIPSLTVGPFASGYVTKRQRLGNAQSGTSMIFENATATNASVYCRSNSGDAISSGTVNGNHSTTVGTTASVQTINSPYTYAFRPTTEYRMAAMSDRLQWHDSAVDAATQTTSRQLWTQVVTDNGKTFKFRIRATTNQSYTVPIAKIVSAQKTGTTTATITTDVPHGLTTTDYVNIYGLSDQTAAWGTLTAATVVASVIDATRFTIVIGTAVTATVYGGYVARVNGGNLMSACGGVPQAAVSATLSTAADGTQTLLLVGNVSWTTLSIGDYVNVHGLRSVPGAGSDLGCDGAWYIRNVISSTTLELGPIGNTTPPANFGATVCGGAVIKRTDMRMSFARVYDFDRTRVELLARPASDMAAAAPVVVQNTPTVTATISGNPAENIAQVGGVAVSSMTDVASTRMLGVFQGITLALTEVASAARTTTGNSGAISASAAAGQAMAAFINITAASGTNPTLDVYLEESYDNGTTWTTIWTAPRKTGISSIQVPPMAVCGRRRWSWTIGGTTPSFTFVVTTQPLAPPVPLSRLIIDRTLVPTTLNSATPAVNVAGCVQIAGRINLSTLGSPAPTFVLEISDDGTDWMQVGSSLTPAGTGLVSLTTASNPANFARIRVSSAGTGSALSYATIVGMG